VLHKVTFPRLHSRRRHRIRALLDKPGDIMPKVTVEAVRRRPLQHEDITKQAMS
jgi:hypothetical protein